MLTTFTDGCHLERSKQKAKTHRSNSVHNTISNNHISSSNLGTVEVDTAIPNSNSDGAVGEGVEDLTVLQEGRVADIVDNDVLAEDGDDLLVGETGGVDGGEGTILGREHGNADGLGDGLDEVILSQEGGEVGELREEGEGVGDGARDFEEAVLEVKGG